MQFPTITALPNGTIVDVTGREGDWLKIRVGSSEGYAVAQFMQLITSAAPAWKPSTTSSLSVQAVMKMTGKVEYCARRRSCRPGTPRRRPDAGAGGAFEAAARGTGHATAELLEP